jgi:hypothetical protein
VFLERCMDALVWRRRPEQRRDTPSATRSKVCGSCSNKRGNGGERGHKRKHITIRWQRGRLSARDSRQTVIERVCT